MHKQQAVLSTLLGIVALGFVPTESRGQYEVLPEVQPPYYRVRYAPNDRPGELAYGVSYTLWIPPGVAQLKGVIVHQHGCGEGACKGGQTAAFDLHWQALAQKHACGLMGPSYEQPDKADCHAWCDARNGSAVAFVKSLTDLAKSSGHPELERVPWALWGHSGGATWAGTMLTLHPDRIAAAWLRSGAPRVIGGPDTRTPPLVIPDAALQIPVMCNLGTKEGVTVKDDRFGKVWSNMEPFFQVIRKRQGLIGVSVDPHSSHDCGNQRYLAIPWFDAVLADRLGEGGELRPMPRDGQWHGDIFGTESKPGASIDGPIEKTVWLPNSRIARLWEQYNRDAAVEDVTPPPAPVSVTVANGRLTWDCAADLESGLQGFHIYRDGLPWRQLPEKTNTNIGRPIFQRASYHDTPSQPLAVMAIEVGESDEGQALRYSVAAVNTVGLMSGFVEARRSP